jgi:hypothetical protein
MRWMFFQLEQPKTLIVLLRSACVGAAALIGAMFLWATAVLFWAAKPLMTGPHPDRQYGREVGIDLVTLIHNFPISTKIVALVAFVIGFGLGLRCFGRALRRT